MTDSSQSPANQQTASEEPFHPPSRMWLNISNCGLKEGMVRVSLETDTMPERVLFESYVIDGVVSQGNNLTRYLQAGRIRDLEARNAELSAPDAVKTLYNQRNEWRARAEAAEARVAELERVSPMFVSYDSFAEMEERAEAAEARARGLEEALREIDRTALTREPGQSDASFYASQCLELRQQARQALASLQCEPEG